MSVTFDSHILRKGLRVPSSVCVRARRFVSECLTERRHYCEVMSNSAFAVAPGFGAKALGLAAVVGTVICSIVAAMSPQLLIGAFVLTALFGIALWRPGVGISIWLVVTVLIPSWTSVSVLGITGGPSYLAIPVVIAVFINRMNRRLGHRELLRLSIADVAAVMSVVLVLVCQAVFNQEQFLATNALIALFCGYVLGRAAEVSMHRVFAVVMVSVAIWGIVEFVFSVHLFVDWQADSMGMGPYVQERGGLSRSEASLGHAIAYGACLAAALPFTTLFKRPLVLQIIIFLGVLVSVSRGPILAVVFTFAILLYVSRSSKHRAAAATLLVVGLAAVYFVFTFLYFGSGQSEVESSGQARDDQLSRSISYTNLFGPADGTQLDSAGRYVTNGVDIVDSAPLRLALDFGWLICALMLVPIVLAGYEVLRRRAGVATVALAGQIPILLVTSFITQWQTMFFFVAGMAVTEMLDRRSRKQRLFGFDGQVVDLPTRLQPNPILRKRELETSAEL
jgi:hypothetical protein